MAGKRKRSDEEEHETERTFQSESKLSDDNEQMGDEEQPLFKTLRDTLSKAVSQHDASELLHSMAASQGILFWTNN